MDGLAIANLLSLALRRWYWEFESRMADLGYADIRPAHSIVFENIGRNGSRQSDMAERALTSKQAIAQVVSYLEERGYVERTSDASDRRASLVKLTAKGRKAVRTAREAMAEMEADWGKRIGEERVEHLRVALQEVLRAGP